MKDLFILGGGITGLTAGYALGAPIFEAEDIPGGICSSYYIRPKENTRLNQSPSDEEAYRFEIGGGHWIFGADREIIDFIEKFTTLERYERRSSVFLNSASPLVLYPIQNNLRFLKKEVIKKVLKEISTNSKRCPPYSMKDWLLYNFGPSLCKLFFYPFHELYTSGLYKKIAPRDSFKSPVDISLIIQGASKETSSVGYNVTFAYPKDGLDILVRRMAENCNIHCNKGVNKIGVRNKKISFKNGTVMPYERLISTLPLNKMVDMTGLRIKEKCDPYTSVVVLNIGAVKGDKCPKDHWLYIPHSKSDFHRVGFYSNVSPSFLPKSARESCDRVSIYVERSYPGGKKPSPRHIKAYSDSSIKELQKWGFIKDVEATDTAWIEVAYTWSYPNSSWKHKALELLEKYNIYQLGRYGQWKFQGIADSIKDGLSCKNIIKNGKKNKILD